MKVETLIEEVPWKATNYIAPHEYVVKTWSRKCADLVEAMRTLISEQGYDSEFLGRTYHYVNIGGYRYWVFELVLNRAQ